MVLMNVSTNVVIAGDVKKAFTFLKRFKGWMFSKDIAADAALHLSPCSSIHTFFMRYDIDVLYLNNRNEIVGLEERLPPGKMGGKFSGARSVVELPAGSISTSNIRVGQLLAFVE